MAHDQDAFGNADVLEESDRILGKVFDCVCNALWGAGVTVTAEIEDDYIVLLDEGWNRERPVQRIAGPAVYQHQRWVGELAMEGIEDLEII